MARDVRIGVFGGTFDPPHTAHVVAAAAARHQLGLERVVVVVANRPWQKADRRLSPAGDRLAMVAEAVADVAGVEVSGIEVDRGGDTYSADTLAELAAAHPGAGLVLILGADAAAGLPAWERLDEVRALSTLAIVTRGDAGGEPPPGWDAEHVRIPRLDISSTDVRRRLVAGEPVDGLVPPGVVRVLRERGLYPPP